MAKEKKPDKNKKKSEEATDYESLLNDFTTIFDDSGEESKDTQLDHDGLALSELLGEDVTMTAGAVDSTDSKKEQDEEYPDLSRELEELDLAEFSESDAVSGASGEEEITVEDSVEQASSEKSGIDELTEIYGGGEISDEEIIVGNSADTQELEGIGLDDLLETETVGETAEEEEIAAGDSGDIQESQVLDLGEIPELDVTGEAAQVEEATGDDSEITQVDDSVSEIILDEELADSGGDYASILDQLDKGEQEKIPEIISLVEKTLKQYKNT